MLTGVEEVLSPALLVYPERIEENIARMIQLAGDVQRLRPHIKTHKLAEVVRMQQTHGISKFKAATLAETEMAAMCGALDVLLAYQPVGPNVSRILELVRHFPATRFSAIIDDAGAAQALSRTFAAAQRVLEVWIDIDCGMHRTGVAPGVPAVQLSDLISRLPGLKLAGLHAYDGHIHDTDLSVLTQRCHEAFAPVLELHARLADKRSGPLPIVAGGTPTFPIHAQRLGVECSPGTCLFWDEGYGSKLPDLPFVPAALVLSRVVSKPGGDRLCLDLGHKAVAAENPPPRVQWLEVSDAHALTHSEEHLVIETSQASRFAVGDCLYGIPWHICPTVALHAEAVVVRGGRAEGRWSILARQRRLTI